MLIGGRERRSRWDVEPMHSIRFRVGEFRPNYTVDEPIVSESLTRPSCHILLMTFGLPGRTSISGGMNPAPLRFFCFAFRFLNCFLFLNDDGTDGRQYAKLAASLQRCSKKSFRLTGCGMHYQTDLVERLRRLNMPFIFSLLYGLVVSDSLPSANSDFRDIVMSRA